MAMGTITDSSCSQNTDADTALGSSSGQDVTMAPSGSTGHPDQYGPSGSMTLGHQHGLKWLSRPWASAQSSVVTGAMDINSDPDWFRVMDRDMQSYVS